MQKAVILCVCAKTHSSNYTWLIVERVASFKEKSYESESAHIPLFPSVSKQSALRDAATDRFDAHDWKGDMSGRAFQALEEAGSRDWQWGEYWDGLSSCWRLCLRTHLSALLHCIMSAEGMNCVCMGLGLLIGDLGQVQAKVAPSDQVWEHRITHVLSMVLFRSME